MNSLKTRSIKGGVTIIELVVSMAIMSVILLVLFKIFLPISQNLTLEANDMENYKQLLFVTMFLDTVYRQSGSISISTSALNLLQTASSSEVFIVFEQKQSSNRQDIVCKIVDSLATSSIDINQSQRKIFTCQNRELIDLSKFGTSSIQIREFLENRRVEMVIGKWIINFGLFPSVLLL